MFRACVVARYLISVCNVGGLGGSGRGRSRAVNPA